MSILRKIKAKIATIEAYLRSNNAMKSVAAVRISKCKKKANILQEINKLNFCEDLAAPVATEKKDLHIIVGCNQGMCGAFFSYISSYIKKIVKEHIKNDYIYILGEKFSDYNIHKNIKVEKLVLSERSFFSVNLKTIEELMIENKITDIYLHYYDKKQVKKDLIVENVKTEKDLCIYRMFCIMNKIMQGSFISSFYENNERVIALEQAKTNAEKMQKKGYNELNRVRQESITNDLAEIVAGVLS